MMHYYECSQYRMLGDIDSVDRLHVDRDVVDSIDLLNFILGVLGHFIVVVLGLLGLLSLLGYLGLLSLLSYLGLLGLLSYLGLLGLLSYLGLLSWVRRYLMKPESIFDTVSACL